MYSVLLDDDERIELDTLKEYVDWAKFEIDQVFTARGARSALECISSQEPDLIITDIEMPRISGIELIDIVRREGYRSKVIFLTGFDKFEYAKEAIRLQVENFLLKPFQIDEVEAAVKKVIERIKEEKHGEKRNRLAMGNVIEQAARIETKELNQMAVDFFDLPAHLVQFGLFAIKGMTEEEKKLVAESQEVIHSFARGHFVAGIPHGPISMGYSVWHKMGTVPFLCYYDTKKGLSLNCAIYLYLPVWG